MTPSLPPCQVHSESALHAQALGAALRAQGSEHVDVEGAKPGELPPPGVVSVVDVTSEAGRALVRDLRRAGRPVVAWGATARSVDPADARMAVGYGMPPERLAHVVRRVLSEGVRPLERSDGDGTSRLQLGERQRVALEAYLVTDAERPRREVAAALGMSDETLKRHIARARASLASPAAATRLGLKRELMARGALSEPVIDP